MTRIVSTICIRREPAAVFNFFTTPENAPNWHPASVSVAGQVDHPLGVDEEFIEELKGPAGVRGRASWRVVAQEAPHLWRIELTDSAPIQMRATVTLRFRADQGATVVERDVQYRYDQRTFVLLDILFLRRRHARDGRDGLRRAKQILEETAP